MLAGVRNALVGREGIWGAALLGLALSFAAPASGVRAQTLRLDVLVVFYPHTFAHWADPGDARIVRDEVAEAADRLHAMSRNRLRLRVDDLVIDRYLHEDEFWEVEPKKYWLGPGSEAGKTGVEHDLVSRGIAKDHYDVVAVFYAWEEAPGQWSRFGGAAYPVNSLLGKAAYLAIPTSWSPDSLDRYFEHEFMHSLESIFEGNGYAPFPAVHGEEIFHALEGPDADWHGWILGMLPDRAYFEPHGHWGSIEPR
jgi:hypothetical protein